MAQGRQADGAGVGGDAPPGDSGQYLKDRVAIMFSQVTEGQGRGKEKGVGFCVRYPSAWAREMRFEPRTTDGLPVCYGDNLVFFGELGLDACCLAVPLSPLVWFAQAGSLI